MIQAEFTRLWTCLDDAVSPHFRETKRTIQVLFDSDINEDITTQPIISGDSLARDLTRPQKEDVHIYQESDETWYLNGRDLEEYYRYAREKVKDLKSNED